MASLIVGRRYRTPLELEASTRIGITVAEHKDVIEGGCACRRRDKEKCQSHQHACPQARCEFSWNPPNARHHRNDLPSHFRPALFCSSQKQRSRRSWVSHSCVVISSGNGPRSPCR